MTWNITEEEAYARGQAAAEGALNGTLQKSTRDNITWARSGYLGLEGVDLEREVLAFSRERMAADLDLTKFPECRGLRERVEAERRGFADRVDDPGADHPASFRRVVLGAQ